MNNSNIVDSAKRNSLKILATITATGLLGSTQVLAGIHSGSDNTAIDCTLIYRADGLRLHLLMQNKTNTAVTAARFNTQPILVDNTIFDLADAYVTPIVIPAMDRVMVRLNIEAGLKKKLSSDKVLPMDTATRLLSQGTRVVNFNATIKHGVGTITLTTPRKILT